MAIVRSFVRVRVLPVLGTTPAIFGQTMVSCSASLGKSNKIVAINDGFCVGNLHGRVWPISNSAERTRTQVSVREHQSRPMFNLARKSLQQ